MHTSTLRGLAALLAFVVAASSVRAGPETPLNDDKLSQVLTQLQEVTNKLSAIQIRQDIQIQSMQNDVSQLKADVSRLNEEIRRLSTVKTNISASINPNPAPPVTGTILLENHYSFPATVIVNGQSIRVMPSEGRRVVAPAGRGWEYVLEQDLVGNAGKWAEEAVQKLSAKSAEVGRYDLVLHPTHLWLTIHESIAHPTELDRALGYEANYAGTSFVAPPEKMLGKFRYGPDFMNIQGDRSQEGGCGTIGYDDEGVKPDTFLIIKNGIVNDYQTTREQANWLKWWYDSQGKPARSHGCSNADSWGTVQFQRMPNVSLLPGAKDISYEDIIAATDRGIAIEGNGSFSIDQQRYNAQFGGQVFHEIKGGKIVGQLKDVAYQMRTPDFWNSMDMIGGPKSYFMGGAFNDGKGQPPQSNAISHGCVPSRFRNINVINTGRKA